MYLKHLSLQDFRNYTKSEFKFSENTTLIVGPNTCGKTNIIEAISLLSNGKSFRTDKDIQMIRFGQELGRVRGEADGEKLEILITGGAVGGKITMPKKFLLNGVSKKRVDFIGSISSVIFSPLDLEIIIGAPGIRRGFLDEVLEQVDREYRLSLTSYTKALRQRNSLLQKAKETGGRFGKQFEYWDDILIQNGQVLTSKRNEFIDFINNSQKEIFDFFLLYDKSLISKERLLQYEREELFAGVTLVGPHRDDFVIGMFNNQKAATHDVKFFGSRGQQRLAVLQLRILELRFLEGKKKTPMLLLDDIFSELDEAHINHVLEMIGKQQTIITTTHKEFIPEATLKKMEIIDLKK